MPEIRSRFKNTEFPFKIGYGILAAREKKCRCSVLVCVIGCSTTDCLGKEALPHSEGAGGDAAEPSNLMVVRKRVHPGM